MTAFNDTPGAMLIGQMIAVFLYGLATLQSYIYFVRYPRDTKELKIWVGSMWLIDTLNVILVCYGIYMILYGSSFPNHDNPMTDQGKKSFDIATGLNVLVAILVQCFFVKRIYQLCEDRVKYWVTAALSILIMIHISLSFYAIVTVLKALAPAEEIVRAELPLNSLVLSTILPYTLAAVVSDASIAVALILLLRNQRTEFESLNSILSRGINFVLTRFVLVSVVAIIRLITFVRLPETMWFAVSDFAMGKLYFNSLLAILNARHPQQKYPITQSSEEGVLTSVLQIEGLGFISTTDSRQQAHSDIERQEKGADQTGEHHSVVHAV
ncbi:hypothetical protein QCA50_005767 [Cerrena zonata]|uniref:DUF6534 domain-containing protein n=1 Tax=Cerrena zonata TaxID=2478898 RepID=A0AAW0GAQ5_9APHY